MKIKIYQDFNEELKSHWRKLEEESYLTPFQSYSWLLNWYKITGLPLHNIDLFIVCLFNKSSVDLILPLGVKTIGKIRRLEWLGGLHSDYMMPVVRKESEFIFNDFESKWLKILSLLPPFDVLASICSFFLLKFALYRVFSFFALILVSEVPHRTFRTSELELGKRF